MLPGTRDRWLSPLAPGGEQHAAHYVTVVRPEPRTCLQHHCELRIWIELGNLRGHLLGDLADRLGNLARCDLLGRGASRCDLRGARSNLSYGA